MRSRLPVPAFLALTLLTGAGALAQAEADRRLDAAIARLRAALGPEARLEIGGRRVDPVTGRAVLTDIVLTEGARRLAVPELHLAEVSEARVGRAELLRPSFRDGTAGSGEAARILLAGLPLPPQGGSLDLANLAFEAVEAEAFRVADPQHGVVSLGRLVLRDWQPGGIGAGALEGLEYRGAGPDLQAFRLGRAALEGVTLPMAAGAFEPTAFRAARLAIEGVELRDTGSGIGFTLGRLALQDWIPGRLTELAVEGLRLAGPGGPFALAEAELGRFALGGVDVATSLAATLGDRQAPHPRPGIPQRLVAEGLDLRGDGQPVLALGRLAIEATLEGGITSGSVVAEGLRIVPPRGRADWLEAIGYREVAGGIEMRGTAPLAGGRLEVAPLAIAWEGAGTLRLAAQVDNSPAAAPEGAPLKPEAMMASYAQAQLAGLTLSFRDQGLLGRVIARQARDQRMPEARLREQWAQMALAMPVPGEPPRRGAPPAAGRDADPFAPMRQALAAFIRQPGTLEIALRPPKPLPFGELGGMAGDSPARSVERLGLTVVAR